MPAPPTSTKPTTLLAMRHGGTHLIQPIIRHLTGKPVAAPKGPMALEFEPGPRLVVFLRDPRNRLISNFRFKAGGGAGAKAAKSGSDEDIAAFMLRAKHGRTPVAFMQAWADRWVKWPGALIVRFEDLVVRDQGITEAWRIKAHLDAPGDPTAAYEYSFGQSGTWTGKHSDWREWFGPKSRAAWEDQGGAKLLTTMGYR